MVKTTLSSLPPELTQLITAHLNTLDFSQCVRVCHAWHSIFEPFLWQDVNLLTDNDHDNSATFVALSRNLHHIRQLTSNDPELIRFIALHLPPLRNLKCLDLYLCEEAPSLLQSISSSPRSGSGSGGVVVPFCMDLTPRLGNTRVLMKLLSGCDDLEVLDLAGHCFRHADGADALQEIMAACPTGSLKRLKIYFVENDSGTCPVLCPQERGISYKHAYQLAISQQRSLPPFVELQELVIGHHMRHIRPSRMAFLVRCPNLRRIELDSPDKCILPYLAKILLEFCPNVVELVWEADTVVDYTDGQFATFLKSSRSGWRVLTMPYTDSFGPLSYEALMRNVSTLEELVLVQWGNGIHVRYDYFLDILHSARSLRLLDGHKDGENRIYENAVEVHALDAFMAHTEGGRDRTWALGPLMKYLQMQVVRVPRPDVRCRDNGRPLQTWMFEEGLDGSRRYDVQRYIYQQLGRMTNLEQLVLGKIDVSRNSLGEVGLGAPFPVETASITDIEDALEDIDERFSLINYQCLEFSLESGLELLAGMKELKVLHVKSTAHRIGVAELDWMHINWPKLKEIKGVVTERKWAGDLEDGLAVKAAVEEWLVAHPHGIGSSFYVGVSSA